MTGERLPRIIEELFTAHGLKSTRYGDWCLWNGGYPALRAAHFPPGVGEAAGQLVVQVQIDDTNCITETFAAIGEGEDGFRDGLDAFVRGMFHVLLTALCGLDCCDQTDTAEIGISGRAWRLTNGPLISRFGEQGLPPCPDGYMDKVICALQKEGPLEAGTHWISLYFGKVVENAAIESLFDNARWQAGAEALETMDWPEWPGPYSYRLFAILQPAEIL